MTLFQKLFPMDGDKSAVQNYGHADQEGYSGVGVGVEG